MESSRKLGRWSCGTRSAAAAERSERGEQGADE